jgi:hypothetical protein
MDKQTDWLSREGARTIGTHKPRSSGKDRVCKRWDTLKNSVGQIIEAFVTVVTLIALTSWFRVVKATLDDLVRLTRGARNAIWPAQLADGLIALGIINEILDVDLHGWTPVRGRRMRWHLYITNGVSF